MAKARDRITDSIREGPPVTDKRADIAPPAGGAPGEEAAARPRVFGAGFDRLLDSSPIPTFVLRRDHRILHWNHALSSLSGLPVEQMVGTDRQWAAFYRAPRPVLADLVMEDDAPARVHTLYGDKAVPSALMEGAFEAEDFFPGLAESGRWLYFTAVPLHDADGGIAGAMETLQDVSARRGAEQALREQQEQLEALVASRTAALREANEALSQYAHVVAHDLRSPLRAIRNYTTFLEEDLAPLLGEAQQRHLAGLRRALRQGDALVRDLLEYALVMRGPVHLQRLELGSLMQGLQELGELDHTTELVLPQHWPAVHGDPTLVFQVLRNLLSNAEKFNRSSPRRILLAWRHLDDGHCEIEVRDNGIGIDPRHHPLIFTGFQRLHPPTEVPGTGFGLASASKAVGRRGGRMRVASEAGAGASFFFTLPRANP